MNNIHKTLAGIKSALTRSGIVACAAIGLLAANPRGASAQCYLQELTAASPQFSASFGVSLATRGNSAMIGDPDAFVGGLQNSAIGRVEMFTRTGAGYVSTQVLTSSLTEDRAGFGWAVSVDQTYAAVGSPFHSLNGVRSAGMVETYRNNGGTWVFEARIFAPAPDSGFTSDFGASISVSGDRVAVGAPFRDKGAVYTFRRNAAGAWLPEQKIAPAFLTQGADFGTRVAMSGNLLAVSAIQQTAGPTLSGEVFIYKFNGSSWVLASGIAGSVPYAYMGASVAVQGNKIAAAAAGNKQLVIVQDTGAGFTTLLDTTLPESDNRHAAFEMAFDDAATRLAVSNYGDFDELPTAVCLYTATGGTYALSRIVTQAPGSVYFGGSVALAGDVLLSSGRDVPLGVVYVMPIASVNAGEDCADAPQVAALDDYVCTGYMQPSGVNSCIADAASPDAWLLFTPSCPGLYTITTQGSDFDTVLSVYDRCGADALIIACNDDYASPQRWSQVTVNVSVPVYLRISGFANSSGVAHIRSAFVGYVNETALTPIQISEGTTTFCTYGATSDSPAGALTCGGSVIPAGSDLWYAFTPGCNSAATISTCGSGFDTVLQVFDAVPGSNSDSIACNDDFCGLQSFVIVDVRAGHTYLIRVSGYNNAQGSGVLNLSTLVSCPADYNSDGGIDGGDVSSFFADWESGAQSADVNCDGGIDGADVSIFFAAWQNGGC